MIKLICIKSILDFKEGLVYHAQGEDFWEDRYEFYEEYVFYGEYDYERDNWEEIRIDKYYFATPAEWREKQIESILL